MSMKGLFPGHFPVIKDDLDKLWAEATFSFDTNVLLNLYEYKKGTTEALLASMEDLKGRVWLPYRVADEYLRGRLKVVNRQLNAYDALTGKVRGFVESLEKATKNHPSLPYDKYASWLKEVVGKIVTDIGTHRQEHDDLTTDDPIRDRLDALFAGAVGAGPGGEYEKRVKDCEQRYKKGLPPGNSSEDQKKEGDDKYGDALIWLELLDHAKTAQKPLVLVTAERKSDWWLKRDGGQDATVVGPRPELATEMAAHAKVRFHLMSVEDYLARVRPVSGSGVPEAVQDVVETQERLDVARDETQEQTYLDRLLSKQDDVRIWAIELTGKHQYATEKMSRFDLETARMAVTPSSESTVLTLRREYTTAQAVRDQCVVVGERLGHILQRIDIADKGRREVGRIDPIGIRRLWLDYQTAVDDARTLLETPL